MEIILKKPEDLILYSNNPRLNDKAADAVANSIRDFGFKVPIVIDRNNVIVTGHTRLKASQKLGLETVPCIVADDLTPEQVKAFRLADNKVTEISEWDFEKLEAELLELDYDMSKFGFEDFSIDEKENVIDDGDDIPEPPKEPKAKRGDIYQLGSHRLMCGDSTSKDDVAMLMNGEKADMVFTSPPYNGDNSAPEGDIFKGKPTKKLYGDGYKDNLASNEYVNFCKDVLDLCFENTHGFIFWNVNYNANSKYEYIQQITDKLGYLIEQICWKKSSAIPLKGCLRRAWEPIYVFSTSGKNLPLKNVESNLWEISNQNCQVANHKACFPVELPAKGISIATEEGGKVFEPFGGSGTTLIACEQLNRNCFMMELDPKYVDVIIERWEQLTGQKAKKING